MQKSNRFQIMWTTREGGRIAKSFMRRQTKAKICLFFLDVGWGLRPPEICIQFQMVSYCSAMKLISYLKSYYNWDYITCNITCNEAVTEDFLIILFFDMFLPFTLY